MSDVYKEAVAGGIRGAANYMADKVTGNKTVEPEPGDMTLEELAQRKHARGKNYRGGLWGVGAAVALELLSPNGSKTSALAAGVAGMTVLHYSKGVLEAAPQNNVLAASAGAAAGWIAMTVGRTMASYFPGNSE